MGNFALAVKWAAKDFFKRQLDHRDFVEVPKRFRCWDYDELVLLTVLAGMHKHTFGVPGSIIEAIKVGRWRYHDLKDLEARADSIFADTDLSADGRKLILKMLRQGKNVDPQQFSKEDAEVLLEIQERAGINRRDCVNI